MKLRKTLLIAPLALSLLWGPRSRADDAGVVSAVPPPPFDAEPVPTEKSPAPTADEWRKANPVALSHNTTECRAYRVREWMKIICTHAAAAGIAQLTGPSEGVDFRMGAPDTSKWDFSPSPMQIIYPLRPGTGHVFQFLRLERNMMTGFATGLECVLSDSWITGEQPLIAMD